MIRILSATVVAAVLVFVWTAISWNVLTWHASHGAPLDDEKAMVAALKDIPESGVYFLPKLPDVAGLDGAEREAAQKAWAGRHLAGPVALIVADVDGRDAMPPMTFVRWFVITLVSALIATVIAAGTLGTVRTYFGRVILIAGLGLFAGIYGDGGNWNWFGFPDDVFIVNVLDKTAAWAIAGLAIAAIIRPRKPH